MSDENGDDVINAIINLVKRIQKMEGRLSTIEAVLSRKFNVPMNGDSSKWNEWARKILAKVLEWLFVIVAAIAGAKLAGV